MYNLEIKKKAKYLRTNGSTVRDIAKKLNVSFSTVSFWCRDIKLSEETINKMSFIKKERSIKGLLRYLELKREKRITDTLSQKKRGITLIGKISDRDVLMLGLGLYWGEGYKESNGELGFTNSNLNIIKFYIKWLGIFGISGDRLIFRLSINNIFEKQENKIKNFWINSLRINKNQFTKTSLVRSKLKKAFIKRGNKYSGVLRVKVRKGLSLKNTILGAIDYVAKG